MDWLWPNFKKIFTDDLERICKEVGGFDTLIFSGDLTQRGSPQEYDTLTALLGELYEQFDKWGTAPLFFPVPGNHDLVRPDADTPESLLLKRWWDEPAVSKQFWRDNSNIYRIHIEKAFSNYTSWTKNLPVAGIKLVNVNPGLLPGDAAGRVQVDGMSIGLIGLNSTFLQLDDGNFSGGLALDVRQILALTEFEPDSWCEANDFNLLISHHPPQWLHPNSQTAFASEISPPGRFTAHLFGHMHESDQLTTSRGGGPSRRNVQGASIFGLEFLRDGTTKRLHGYSAGKISKTDTSAEWRMWPRVEHLRLDGTRRLIPDYDFALIPGTEYVKESIENVRGVIQDVKKDSSIPLHSELTLISTGDNGLGQAILRRAHYNLYDLDQHLHVRATAQQACAAALALDRMAWICTDWGLGTDGFIFSVIKASGRSLQSVYQIDLGNYLNREDFLSKFPEIYGCSFADFCKFLLHAGPATLVLNEAPSGASNQSGNLVTDVEQLGQMILDFCPQIVALAITRSLPAGANLAHVELSPFDELDTRAYFFNHRNSTEEIKNSQSVTQIFRLTEGVPSKIETLLRKLRVANLEDLSVVRLSARSESTATSEGIPRSLITAVSAILDSDDPNLARTGLMLKLLCILPHGETLQKIKRFDSHKIFYEQHAEDLLDLALIDVKTPAGVMNTPGKPQGAIKLLSARGPVREYVQSLLSEREIETLTKRAMALYFEQQRSTGQWKIRGRDGVSISEDTTTLNNGHELAMRSLAKAISLNQKTRIKAALSLSQLYCGELIKGKHYRACAAACDAILNSIRSEITSFDDEVFSIKFLLARCVRMLGEHVRAKALLEELSARDWPKVLKVSILINYALCLQSLKDRTAIKIAKELIALSPKSDSAIQARAIIIEMAHEENSRAELLKLEADAKKRGAILVLNNLILSRADSAGINSDILLVLQEVVISSFKQNDPYTAGRAAVKIAKIARKQQIELSGTMLKSLIQAYQYFYGQRFNELFGEAHDVLWDVFETLRDVPNLLSLFKHSSFIWRLGGSDDREKPYALRLTNAATSLLSTDLRTADQDTAYFVARARRLKL